MSRKKLIAVVSVCIVVIIVVLIISLSRHGRLGDSVVTFRDPNLKAAIRAALDKPWWKPIYASGFGELAYLDASSGEIGDLSGLQYCTNLTELRLWSKQMSDISPLADLTNLTKLYLWGNQISDISPLRNLIRLRFLWLVSNQITDISPLAKLTNLTYVDLGDNRISDISPLVENTGLFQGDGVNLLDNPLSSDSINIYIPQLQARGVIVNY